MEAILSGLFASAPICSWCFDDIPHDPELSAFVDSASKAGPMHFRFYHNACTAWVKPGALEGDVTSLIHGCVVCGTRLPALAPDDGEPLIFYPFKKKRRGKTRKGKPFAPPEGAVRDLFQEAALMVVGGDVNATWEVWYNMTVGLRPYRKYTVYNRTKDKVFKVLREAHNAALEYKFQKQELNTSY